MRLRDFDVLRHGAEVFHAGVGDEHEVLDADAADLVVVQAGFDRDDVSGLEQLKIARGEPGLFVDLQSDAVPEAVEVSASRCIQRLSDPDADTRRCSWRNNR